MPLINTSSFAIHEVLAEVLEPERKIVAKDAPLLDKMESKGIGPNEILTELAEIIKTSSSEHLRMRGIENCLKMAGLLKDSQVSAAPASQFIVIIKDSNAAEVNPILIPREVSL